MCPAKEILTKASMKAAVESLAVKKVLWTVARNPESPRGRSSARYTVTEYLALWRVFVIPTGNSRFLKNWRNTIDKNTPHPSSYVRVQNAYVLLTSFIPLYSDVPVTTK